MMMAMVLQIQWTIVHMFQIVINLMQMVMELEQHVMAMKIQVVTTQEITPVTTTQVVLQVRFSALPASASPI
jgi:hypothetical protein